MGVSSALQDLGLLTQDTPCAGASAGSLIATCVKSGLPLDTVLQASLALSADCRASGTRFRLRTVLQAFLTDLLPEDIHLRCSGNTYVAVTRLWPRVTPMLISSFASKQDLIDHLLASCYIPWYFDGSLATSLSTRSGLYCDGGITNFTPLPPSNAAQRRVRVSCFPITSEALKHDISPGQRAEQPWPHDINTHLRWAFVPADDATLLMLAQQGKEDAQAWALSAGLLEAASGSAAIITDGPQQRKAVAAGKEAAAPVGAGASAVASGGTMK